MGGEQELVFKTLCSELLTPLPSYWLTEPDNLHV